MQLCFGPVAPLSAGWTPVSQTVRTAGLSFSYAAQWPLLTGTLRRVYADDVVSRLNPADRQLWWREAFRTLGCGGRLRVIVPTVDRLVAAWTAGTLQEWAITPGMLGDPECGPTAQTLHTEHTLRQEVQQAGFTDVACMLATQTRELGDSADGFARLPVPAWRADLCTAVEATKW